MCLHFDLVIYVGLSSHGQQQQKKKSPFKSYCCCCFPFTFQTYFIFFTVYFPVISRNPLTFHYSILLCLKTKKGNLIAAELFYSFLFFFQPSRFLFCFSFLSHPLPVSQGLPMWTLQQKYALSQPTGSSVFNVLKLQKPTKSSCETKTVKCVKDRKLSASKQNNMQGEESPLNTK